MRCLRSRGCARWDQMYGPLSDVFSPPLPSRFPNGPQDVNPAEVILNCLLCPILCPLRCAFNCCLGCCLLTAVGTAMGVQAGQGQRMQ